VSGAGAVSGAGVLLGVRREMSGRWHP
jgi:hypothetical protein